MNGKHGKCQNLGQTGRNRRSPNPHPHMHDQHIVHDDIHHRTNRYSRSCQLWESIRFDKHLHGIRYDKEKRKPDQHAKIIMHIGQCYFTGSQKQGKFILKYQRQQSDDQGTDGQKNRVPRECFICAFHIVFSTEDGYNRTRSNREENGKCKDEIDIRHGDIHCGKCMLANKTGYVNTVHHRIQIEDQHGYHAGNYKFKKLLFMIHIITSLA